MNAVSSKMIGGLALTVGIAGILAVVTLLLFFLGLFAYIPSLSFMGSLNDTMNIFASILSAILASVLHAPLRKLARRLSAVMLIAAWAGAIVVTFGSWLIITGRADVELSSYYFFFGNALIGIWLFALNRIAYRQYIWSERLTRWGSITSVFMILGLLGLYGILSGSDGSDYSPLVMIAGLSFLGTGILYPIWALCLGRWILTQGSGNLMRGEETSNS